jgi:restriction endonuclease S subunit
MTIQQNIRADLKSLAKVQMGYSFRARLDVSGGEVSIVQMKDFRDDDTIDCRYLTKVDMEGVKERHLARRKDLIFRPRGQWITSAIINDDPGLAVVSAPLLIIRVKYEERVLPEYLNWWINQRESQVFLKSRSMGSLQKMVSKKTIEELEVVLPDLKRQKQIVELASLVAKEKELLHVIAEKREHLITKKLLQVAKGN